MSAVKEDNTSRLVFYSRYEFSIKEKILYFCEGITIGGLVCWLCYHNIYFSPLAMVIAIIFIKLKKKSLIKKRRQVMLYHFKDLISTLHTLLRSGNSVENAIIAAARDLETLYGEKDDLVIELKKISAQLKLRVKADELFSDLGERSDLSDIKMFAELLSIGKRTGGNMGKLLMDTSQILCDKIDCKQEIDAMIASKVMENKVMSIIPAGIVVYMRVGFPGFIEMLYGNTAGMLFMSVCLLIYAAALLLSKKIVDIDLV